MKNIISKKGVEIEIVQNGFSGFIPIKEIMWCFCEEIPAEITQDTNLEVLIIDYDNYHNSIICSLKKKKPNDFEYIISEIEIGTEVFGELDHIGKNEIYLKIIYENYNGFGYVHKSEISNISYITENDLNLVFDLNNRYDFIVKRIDAKNKIIELSRKKYFLNNMQYVEYGDEYEGRIISIQADYALVHYDKFEAKLNSNSHNLGEVIKTIVARKGRIIEVEIS